MRCENIFIPPRKMHSPSMFILQSEHTHTHDIFADVRREMRGSLIERWLIKRIRSLTVNAPIHIAPLGEFGGKTDREFENAFREIRECRHVRIRNSRWILYVAIYYHRSISRTGSNVGVDVRWWSTDLNKCTSSGYFHLLTQ